MRVSQWDKSAEPAVACIDADQPADVPTQLAGPLLGIARRPKWALPRAWQCRVAHMNAPPTVVLDVTIVYTGWTQSVSLADPTSPRGGYMPIHIDQRACTGHGVCEELAPHIFEVGDDGSAHLLAPPTPADREVLLDAIDRCPTRALSWHAT
jgi:ferredoxin